MKLTSIVIYILTLVLSVLLLSSCTTKSHIPQGQWIIAVGKVQYPVEIAHLNADELMLTSTLKEISGRYSIHDNKMSMVKASVPRISGIEFELNTSNNPALAG